MSSQPKTIEGLIDKLEGIIDSPYTHDLIAQAIRTYVGDAELVPKRPPPQPDPRQAPLL